MYFIRFNNDDGSSEEIELQRGHIFSKCHVCGQEFVPFRIEFDHECDSEEEHKIMNLCAECRAVYAEKEEDKRREERYIHLGKEVSRAFKKEITPEEIQQFLADYKDIECGAVAAAVQERFGSAQSSNTTRKKQKIAQQAKTVIIIPRREPR